MKAPDVPVGGEKVKMFPVVLKVVQVGILILNMATV